MEVFAEDIQGESEGAGNIVVAEVQAIDERFGVLALQPQSGLLVVKEIGADAVLVVHVQQFSFLLGDFFQNTFAAIDLLLGGGNSLAKVGSDHLADFLTFRVAERHTGVVILDGRLHEIDGLVALWAFAALIARAEKVFVDAAVAFVAGVDQSAAAGAAPDRALEVVLVLAVTLAGQAVGYEDGLDLVEQLLCDEPWVSSLVLLATVGDGPGVVRVGEQLVDSREVQWLWRITAATA